MLHQQPLFLWRSSLGPVHLRGSRILVAAQKLPSSPTTTHLLIRPTAEKPGTLEIETMIAVAVVIEIEIVVAVAVAIEIEMVVAVAVVTEMVVAVEIEIEMVVVVARGTVGVATRCLRFRKTVRLRW
jgi:hypothetical protein